MEHNLLHEQSKEHPLLAESGGCRGQKFHQAPVTDG
jgi:hypothetical protein